MARVASGRSARTAAIIVLACLAGAVIAIWAFSARTVSIGERLRIVARDPAVSDIPPETRRTSASAHACLEVPGFGPYFAWHYSYTKRGLLDSVFRFYDERMKKDGWELLTSSTTTAPPLTSTTSLSPVTRGGTTTSWLPPISNSRGHDLTTRYSKSYGSWKAQATVQPEGSRERKGFSLVVVVDDEAPKGCE
jgi:hypothetical protein